MDKEKMKELMGQILAYCDQAYDPNWQPKSFDEFVKLGNICREAVNELSKSDWVSVEDDLPPYDEAVLVTDEEHPDEIWFAHRTKNRRRVVVDEYGFAIAYGTITHWQYVEPIKK